MEVGGGGGGGGWLTPLNPHPHRSVPLFSFSFLLPCFHPVFFSLNIHPTFLPPATRHPPGPTHPPSRHRRHFLSFLTNIVSPFSKFGNTCNCDEIELAVDSIKRRRFD